MKQGKRLTRNQKIACSNNGLNADDWLLIKETEFYLYLINKQGNVRKTIDKFAKK